MSSSPRLQPELPALRSEKTLPSAHPFPYDSVPVQAGRGLGIEGMAEDSATDAAARETQIRSLGRQEGQAEVRKSLDEQVARERAGVAFALEHFARDRAAFFQKVEGEVVQLALSIARKILHRETQIDPLLLAGMTRVALEKIDGATKVQLRVHPSHAAEWRQYFVQHLSAVNLPEIIEDPAQEPDRCILQTAMGTAVVGVEVQLKEIEQGLMDLLAARPGAIS